MGRNFAPFEVVVHHTGSKTQMDLQNYIDEFYLHQIRERIYNSALPYEQKITIIEKIAEQHT